MGAERNLAVFDLRREQDAPAVFRHADIVEHRPALRIDADRGAQIDQRLLKAVRAHVLPPVDVTGVPFLQRALDAGVALEADIVGDEAAVIDLLDIHDYTLSLSNVAFLPVP
jgi:hypothetical protein